jgi:hypothetical protein
VRQHTGPILSCAIDVHYVQKASGLQDSAQDQKMSQTPIIESPPIIPPQVSMLSLSRKNSNFGEILV